MTNLTCEEMEREGEVTRSTENKEMTKKIKVRNRFKVCSVIDYEIFKATQKIIQFGLSLWKTN